MKLSDRTLRTLAVLCSVLMLLVSALPLYAISLYNHPYYDDYGFSAAVHQVWKETGSFGAVLRQALVSAQETRMNWQGTYTGTLLSNVQPGVFSEGLYWIGAVFLLTAFLGCGWFFLATVFGKKGFGLAGWQTAVLCCLVLSLLLLLMPDTGEAWYWFNGGVGNVFIYSLMMLFAALAVRLWQAAGRLRVAGLTAALVLVAALLGGGSYSGGLFSLCALALVLLWSLIRRHWQGWRLVLPTAVLACGFLYSMSAPGNAQRAALIGSQLPPVKAVLQSLYYGTALMGEYLSLPLLAVTGLLLPFFWQAAGQRERRPFHPWLLGVLLAALFCTQLTPPLYSGVHIGGGRTVNTYFISFVVLWLLFVYNTTAYLRRRMGISPRLSGPLRLGCAFVLICALAVGLCGVKPDGEVLYGPQNLSSLKAALSIVTGEARQYDAEMSAREQLLNDETQPVVTLAPLTAVPDVFMDDLLVPGALYDARPSLCAYYGKEAVHIQGEEVQP